MKHDTDALHTVDAQTDTLLASTMPTIVTVGFPKGGETFRGGDQLTVEWTTQGAVGAHAVLLSEDNGLTYTKRSPELDAEARSFTFTLPVQGRLSATSRVRVAAKNAPNGTRVAVGDSAPFTILRSRHVG